MKKDKKPGLEHYFETIDKIKATVDKILKDMEDYKKVQAANMEKLQNRRKK